METLRLHIKYSSGTVSFEFECRTQNSRLRTQDFKILWLLTRNVNIGPKRSDIGLAAQPENNTQC